MKPKSAPKIKYEDVKVGDQFKMLDKYGNPAVHVVVHVTSKQFVLRSILRKDVADSTSGEAYWKDTGHAVSKVRLSRMHIEGPASQQDVAVVHQREADKDAENEKRQAKIQTLRNKETAMVQPLHDGEYGETVRCSYEEGGVPFPCYTIEFAQLTEEQATALVKAVSAVTAGKTTLPRPSSDERELREVLRRVVNLAGHPYFPEVKDLPVWEETIEAARKVI